jgi:hypothetical protein
MCFSHISTITKIIFQISIIEKIFSNHVTYLNVHVLQMCLLVVHVFHGRKRFFYSGERDQGSVCLQKSCFLLESEFWKVNSWKTLSSV